MARSVTLRITIESMCACLVAQLCLTLSDPWALAREAPLCDSPGKNTGVGSHFFLQGIFLIQG